MGSSDLVGLEWSGFGLKSTPVQIALGLVSSYISWISAWRGIALHCIQYEVDLDPVQQDHCRGVASLLALVALESCFVLLEMVKSLLCVFALKAK